MWKYEKKLQYPVNIKNKDLNMAKCILTQYGGPYSNWDNWRNGLCEMDVFTLKLGVKRGKNTFTVP